MEEKAKNVVRQRAVILCRSEAHDRSETTLQESLAAVFAKAQGWSVIRTYTEFGSAEMKERTSLRDFRRMAMYKDFEVLIVPNLDVFGYTPDEVSEEVRFMNENGVKFVSLQEGELTVEKLPDIFRKSFRFVK